MDVINIQDKLALFKDHWSPRIVGELNGQYIKLAKFSGEFVWHDHAEEDELFLVVKGTLRIRLEDRDLHLREGEFTIIPKGVRHLPIAAEEVHVILLEPKSTVSTGEVQDARSTQGAWI
ncbi:cupin domain-containing protein [Myxococcaceae bacterium GXIMD 01537]